MLMLIISRSLKEGAASIASFRLEYFMFKMLVSNFSIHKDLSGIMPITNR